eukprot:gene7083-6709_t
MAIWIFVGIMLAVFALWLRGRAARARRYFKKSDCFNAEGAKPASETPGKKRVLVTGGCGVLGSKLMAMLCEDPRNHVSVLDVCAPRRRARGVAYFRGDLRVDDHVDRAME